MGLDSSDEDPIDPEAAFRIWVNGPRGRRRKQRGAVIKAGRDVLKTVELTHYGSETDNEARERKLRFRTHNIRGAGVVDFDDEKADKNTWFCENDEIERLFAFLDNDATRTGRYQIVDVDSPGAALLELMANNRVDPHSLIEALTRHPMAEQIVALLANSDVGMSAAQAAVLDRRRKLIAQLRELVDNPASTEPQVQNLIGNAYWIFGGRYVGVAERRSLTMLDQTDVPLLGADGTLHIVELKRPSIDKLIMQHRNHWIAGPAVHEATAQAMNYLRSLDEQGLGLSTMYRNELGQNYDMTRVFATVVIGHSDHHRPDQVEREVVARTLRQYNAGLNRIEVITYDQLVDSAERPLRFEHDSQNNPSSAASTTVTDPTQHPGCRGSATTAPWPTGEPPF
jgi:hypothetical protein